MLFVPQLFTGHRGANTSGLSPRLWAKVYGSIMAPDGADRLVFVSDDFLTPRVLDTSTDIFSEQVYTSYIDASNTITQLADESGGVLALTTDASANDEVWISAGDGTGGLGYISDTAGADFLTVFEARFKVSSIADSAVSHFIGLSTPGLAAQNTKVDTTGALATAGSFIGFDNLLDGDGLDFIYKKANQTIVTKIADAHTLVADDFVKVGFIYDPSAKASQRVKVFVNNVESSTYVSASDIASTTSYFPDAVMLAFLAGFKTPGGVAAEMAIDWWAFAQLIKPATN